jgi:PAS domain S-box-containing protein
VHFEGRVPRPAAEVDAVESVFAGSGAARDAHRAVDWRDTPLGPVSNWSETLRATVRLLLSSRFPMIMFWGPSYIQFYNDAFAPSLAEKAAAGRPGHETWAEIWAFLADQLDKVEPTGEANYYEDQLIEMVRRGFLEETYFTYSHSPLYGDDHSFLGILCTTTETTDRVLAQRRLDTLRVLASAGTGAPTVTEACERACLALEENPHDLPFALLYLREGSESRARLTATAGIPGGAPAAPHWVEPRDEHATWPVARVIDGGASVVVSDLPIRFPALSVGPWPESPHSALLLPLRTAPDGETVGVLVMGLSARLPLDTRYREFLDLVGTRVEASLAEARTREGERQRIDMLAELDRAKTDFFSNVSHEFRTPLTLVMGPVERLRTRVHDPELRADLDTVHRNGLRMGKLVNTLLEFSRIQAGRVDARYEPADLAAMTQELASTFRSAIERAGLTFEVDCPRLAEPVYVDRSMWEKIVLNLLSNALKFTLDGSVGVTLRAEAGAAVLRVADTGVGVPATEMSRLFERFHRVHRPKARSMEGSGIGLALVQELVALQGGTVSVTSTVDVGSTFTVTVPLGREHLPPEQVFPAATDRDPHAAAEPFAAEALRWLPDSDPVDPAPDTDPMSAELSRVLVVDDNADMRDYLRRLLSGRYQVQTVGDGRAALEAVRTDVPDLVLADVMMPESDGIELVAALRADPLTAPVPVVLLSARAGQEASVEGLAAGADDYLVKPFSSAELLARVDSHVRLGRVRREAELRFRALVDSAPALIWVDGPAARRVFANRAWTELVGADGPGAELGLRWRERIHPADRRRYAEARASAESRAAPFEVEYRLRRADGRHRWVLDRGAPVGSPGRPDGYVGACLDIDSRHRERERQRLLAAITGELERGTTLQERQYALVRALVAEGLADLVRLTSIDETGHSTMRAFAGRTEEQRRLLAEQEPSQREEDAVASGPQILEIDDRYLDAGSPDPVQRDLRRRLDMRTVARVPLIARGRVAGVLGAVRTSASPAHDADDLALLVEIGQRAATALDNASLLELEQRTSRRLELLQEATAALSAAATPGQVADATVLQFERLLDTPAVAVFELHETGTLDALTFGGWNEAARRDWSSLPLDGPAPVALAARRRESIWVERTEDWRRDFPDLLPVVRGYGYCTVDCLPLVAAGQCLGVVALGFQTERPLSQSERSAARALADQCAQALQRAGLLAAESEARRAAEDLSKLVSGLSGATTPAEVGAVILGYAADLGATDTVVMVRAGDQLEVLARTSPSAIERMRLDAAHPMAHAVRTGEAVWVANRSQTAWPDGSFASDGTSVPVQVTLPMMAGRTALGAIGLHFGERVPTVSAAQRAGILTVAGQCAQALDRARLYQAKHELADVLQHSLLPHKLPELARLSAAARYLPAAAGTQAGGDWYDLLPIGETTVALAVGDVVGHGAPAAAVMGQLRSALAAYLLEGHSPAAALDRLDQFADRIEGSLGSTCTCLTLDWASGELCYATAGHPPILLLDADGPRYLDRVAGTVLGVIEQPPHREGRTVVSPGTSVVLYTDGLVERRNENFGSGLDRLAHAAADLTFLGPDALVTALVRRMLDATEPPDDVAVVSVRLIPRPLRERLPTSPSALRAMRRTVDDWSARAGLTRELTQDLQRTLGEAVANASEHAYRGRPGEFDYEIARTITGCIDVQVRDHGSWRPPPDDMGDRGRGLRVIRAIAEQVHIDTDSGTTVRFRLRPPGVASGLGGAHGQQRDVMAEPVVREGLD